MTAKAKDTKKGPAKEGPKQEQHGRPRISDIIIQYRRDNPSSTPDEILAHVKRKVPGAQTSLASISSTLSRAGMATGRVFRPPEGGFDGWAETAQPERPEEPQETDEQARERILKRYGAMERLGKRLVDGLMRSLIVSGPPGMSKSFTMTKVLAATRRHRHDGLENVGGGGAVKDKDGAIVHPGWYDHISGTATAVGLYHALWNMRNGGLILLDDCDALFWDEDALNLLKIATDSTRERLCSWRKNASWLAEFEIEKTFDFQGHIAFLTNWDFEAMIRRNHKDSEHFKALIDRASYLCLTLRTPRDFMIWIREVCDGDHGMLATGFGLGRKERDEIFKFVDDNRDRWYMLSIRLLVHAASRYTEDRKGWKDDLEATKMRTW